MPYEKVLERVRAHNLGPHKAHHVLRDIENVHYILGGKCTVFQCSALRLDGTLCAVAFKVLDEELWLPHGVKPKVTTRNADTILQEVVRILEVNRLAPLCPVQVIVHTLAHPHGIVMEPRVAGVLFEWDAGTGVDAMHRDFRHQSCHEKKQWSSPTFFMARGEKVLRCVHHLHQVLIVHRDLKWRNVTVGEDGGVRLLDIGGGLIDPLGLLPLGPLGAKGVRDVGISSNEAAARETLRKHRTWVPSGWQPDQYLRLYGCLPEAVEEAVTPTGSSRSVSMVTSANAPAISKQAAQVVADKKFANAAYERITSVTKGCQGDAGTPGYRPPEGSRGSCILQWPTLKQNRHGKQDLKKLEVGMATVSFAMPLDCYAAGIMIVELVMGRRAAEMSVEWGEAQRAHLGQAFVVPGLVLPHKDGFKFGRDNLLHLWVQEVILARTDMEVVAEMRASRGKGARGARESSEQRKRWTALAILVKGLLDHDPNARWTSKAACIWASTK